jgi:hypothetical protein
VDVDGGLTALDELKLLRLKSAHPEHRAVSVEALRGVFDLAFRAIADKDAEIARLQAELDAASEHPVEYVTISGLEAAMTVDPHREDGALLRLTDGDRQAFAWRAARQVWEPVQ